ncbi:RNA polymerase sigma factor [Gaoshiqia sp. Z1-71]|uniref:RNA polymerase sigma factor n=1 Tax=Gaoshiqia hydrogeniformans TaxID=3290090 RepID=UPI003BF8C4E8
MKKIPFHTDDDALIRKLQKGDPLAFEAIFSKYSHKLYQFSLAYLKSESDAEEIVQEVFLKLWEKRKDIKTETSFQSYLFTVTLNFIKRFFNRKARADQYKHELATQFFEGNNQVESSVTYQDLLNKLETLIDQLPEKRKQIFIERKQHDKPVKQIAEELGITPKTVENQLTRALNFLRSELQKDHFGGFLFYHLFIRQ